MGYIACIVDFESEDGYELSITGQGQLTMRGLSNIFRAIHGSSMTTLNQRGWLTGNIRMTNMVNQGRIQDRGKTAHRRDSL